MDPPSVTAFNKDEGDPPSRRDSGGRGSTEDDDDDEDDAIATLKPSPPTSTSPSPSPSPPSEPSASPPPVASNGRITVTLASQPERKLSPTVSPSLTPVTTQEPAPLQVLALAVPSQNPFSGGSNFSGSSGGGGGGGGREDYWTESATEVLIDAWAERYVAVTEGNLKQINWKEVADIVNGADDRSKAPRTDIQCKNRIDTVKKKYRTERARFVAGGLLSNWKFFERMDQLLGHTVAATVATAKRGDSNPGPVAAGMKSGMGSDKVQKAGAKGQRSKAKSKKRGWGSTWESMGDDYEDADDDGAEEENVMEGLLPPLPPPLRRKISEMPTKGTDGNGHRRKVGGGTAVLELTRAIESFGEVYEKTERAKLREVVEMEKQRMKFAKEMEVQRMQFFMKTQVEIAKHVNKKSRRDDRSGKADVTEDGNGGGCDAD